MRIIFDLSCSIMSLTREVKAPSTHTQKTLRFSKPNGRKCWRLVTRITTRGCRSRVHRGKTQTHYIVVLTSNAAYSNAMPLPACRKSRFNNLVANLEARISDGLPIFHHDSQRHPECRESTCASIPVGVRQTS